MNKQYFKRYREDDLVFRLYFNNGSITLSKRKCGSRIADIIELCKRDGVKYRNYFEINENRETVTVYHWNETEQQETKILLDYDFWYIYREKYFTIQLDYPNIFLDGKYHRVHRIVMGLERNYDPSKDKDIVDHLNGNTYDNRRRNLRIVSHGLNAKNKGFFNGNKTESGVHGVTRTANKDRWRVRFERNSNQKTFDLLSEAVEYRYKEGVKRGYYFREGSTTIENHINALRKRGK